MSWIAAIEERLLGYRGGERYVPEGGRRAVVDEASDWFDRPTEIEARAESAESQRDAFDKGLDETIELLKRANDDCAAQHERADAAESQLAALRDGVE